MGVREADEMRSKLLAKSPLLSKDQQKIAESLAKKAEERCRELEIDWLYQKFIQLSEEAQKTFLQRIENIHSFS